MTTSTTLLVMAKEPVPGRVKTRLCPPLSAEQAAAVAAAAIADTLHAASGCRRVGRVVVALDGAPGGWLDTGAVEVVAQRGATFNQRLAAAWAAVDGPTLQIGMDTPQLTSTLLDRCAEITAASDAALGLACDGGWWALGMRRPDPGVFAGVPMSTADTGRLQAAALRHRGLRVTPLPTLRDVDDIDAALAVAAAVPTTRFARELGRALVGGRAR